MTFYFSLASVLGLLLGSFYNVVGIRVPIGESIVRPRSFCRNCKRTLQFGELIPLFSYLLQRGKCKGCQTRVSPIYPLMEFGVSVLFTISPWLVGWSKELLIAWSLISLLAIIVVSDLHYLIIPDRILIVFCLLWIIFRFFYPYESWSSMILGAAIGFAIPLVISIVSKGGMGGGDIKLFAVLGLVLGWKGVLLAFFLSTFFGTIIGLIGIAAGKVRRGKPMPFGPAIAIGTIVTYFWGDSLISVYAQIFQF